MSLSPSATKPDTSVSSEASSIRRSFSTPSYGGPVFEDDDVVIGMSLVSLAENEKKKKKKGWKNGWSRGSASESDLRSPTKEFLGGRTGSAEEAVVVGGGGGGGGKKEKGKGKGKKVLGWTTKWKRRNSDPTVIIPERNSIEEGTVTSSSSSSSTSSPLEFILPSPDILPVETPTTEPIFLGVPPPSTTHRSSDSAEGTRRGSGRTRLGNFARTRSVGFSHFSFSSKKVYTVEGLFQSCVSKLSVSAPLALREQMLLYRLLQRLSARNKSSVRGLVQPGESNGNRNSYPALLRNSRSFPIQPLIPSSYFDRPPTPTPPPPPAPPGSPYPDSSLPTSPNPLDINPLAKSPSLRKRLAGKIAKPRRRSSVKKSNPLSSTSEDQMRKNSTKRKKKKKAEGEEEKEKEKEEKGQGQGKGPTERKDSAFPEDPKTIPEEIEEPNPKSDEIIPKSPPKTDRRRFSFQKLSTTINPFLSTIYPLPNNSSNDTSFEKDTNEPPSFSPNTIQPGKNSILTFQAPPKTWVASTIFQRQAHETCDWIENPVFDVVENPDVNPDAPDSSVETLSSSSSSSLTGSQPSLLKLQPLVQHAEIVRYALAEGATETH